MLEIVKSPANWVRPSVPATVPRSSVMVELPAPVVKPVRATLGAAGVKLRGVPSVSKVMAPVPTALPEEVAPPSRVGSEAAQDQALTAVLVKVMSMSWALPRESKTCAVTKWLSPTSAVDRSEEHTSELQSLMRLSYAVFCLQKKK